MKRHAHGHLGGIDLVASDWEGQSDFYEALFGWSHHDEPTDMGPPYRMFTLDGKDVAGAGPISPGMEAQGIPSSWNAYIIAEDIDAIAARAAELGAQVIRPAMDLMEFGRMLGIMDPTGAPTYFWQQWNHKGAQVFGEPGSLLWNDLNTRDMNAAADFYEELLGWQVDRSGENDPDYWSFVVDGEAEGGIMRMGEQFSAEVPAHWLTYFAVDEARATVQRAKELGGTAEMEAMEIPVCVFCVLSDPAGAVFAVMQMKER